MIDKQHLKDWIKTKPNGRAWLATACGVSEATVNNWLSTRPIPKRDQAKIKDLIANETQSARILTIPFTDDEFQALEINAIKQGFPSLRDFVRTTILSTARAKGTHVTLPDLKVSAPDLDIAAEDPHPALRSKRVS